MTTRTPKMVTKFIWSEAGKLERHSFAASKLNVADDITVVAFREHIDRLQALVDKLAGALVEVGDDPDA